MKVNYFENLIADVPLNPLCINLEKKISGNGIMLPYENMDFKTAIKPLLDDVVKEAGLSWVPDYEKSSVYFYIVNNEIYLSVEVLPKHLSATERLNMLQNASCEETEDGWSEELRLMNMFDDIDEILNCSYPVGEVGVYGLDMTDDERKEVFEALSSLK